MCTPSGPPRSTPLSLNGAIRATGPATSPLATPVTSSATRPIGELMPRWHQELAEVGWSVPDLVAAVDLAAQQAELPGPLSEREVLRITREALGPESRLSTEKVFTAADVVINVSPNLFGRPLEELATVVGRVLAAPESVPLLDQAVEDLTRDWSPTAGPAGPIDTGTPPPTPSTSNDTKPPLPPSEKLSASPASKPNARRPKLRSHPTGHQSSERRRSVSLPSTVQTGPRSRPRSLRRHRPRPGQPRPQHRPQPPPRKPNASREHRQPPDAPPLAA